MMDIKVIRREETVLRHGGMGDNFHMSWAQDDRQYLSLCDGLGWTEQPAGDWVYNTRLLAVEGGARDARFHDLPGYPSLTQSPYGKNQKPRYYGFGTLALDDHIYQYLSTFSDRVDSPHLRFNGAKLIYSPDGGRTWCNQDGSTPVVWEDWSHRSRKTLVFFDEPQETFSLLTVLQMGKNYQQNRDGYVYVYAPNGNTEGTMNELVLFRTPKSQILNRNAYEYFAGLGSRGAASWSQQIEARKPVHTFPSGWVNKTMHPYAWHPSVVYNAPLGLYLMVNWGMGTAEDGGWFAKPSYLGFWVAQNPWGPWTQIHEETAWMPAEEKSARAYQPQIAPKWIAPDGKSFWLVWTDYQNTTKEFAAEMALLGKKPDLTREERWRLIELMRRSAPYYAFNVQRVDLV